MKIIIKNGVLSRVADDSLKVIFSDALLCWLHSALHVDSPLRFFHQYVSSAIKEDTFAIVYNEKGSVVAYVSWAWLSLNAESRYIKDTTALVEGDWRSGDRLWFIDWICIGISPKLLVEYFRAYPFSSSMGRAIRVKRNKKTGIIKEFLGLNISSKMRDEWRSRFLKDHHIQV